MYYLAKDKEDELLECGFEELNTKYRWTCYSKDSKGKVTGALDVVIDKKTKMLSLVCTGNVQGNSIDLAEEKIGELYNKGLVYTKVVLPKNPDDLIPDFSKKE